jgi:hypothetical protein
MLLFYRVYVCTLSLLQAERKYGDQSKTLFK